MAAGDAGRWTAPRTVLPVVLGDRPVEITLSRAWAALPLQRRAALCGDLLRGAFGAPREALSEELVERLKSDDAVGAFFKQLSDSYPELVAPLVTERDLYLAWSLKRSRAVNGAARVVGVVGRGHLRGLVYALMKDQGGAGL
ncbi:TraB domain-containing protein, partial [Tetrabaena socialis]